MENVSPKRSVKLQRAIWYALVMFSTPEYMPPSRIPAENTNKDLGGEHCAEDDDQGEQNIACERNRWTIGSSFTIFAYCLTSTIQPTISYHLPHFTSPYHAMSHHAIPCYTIPCHTIPYRIHTIPPYKFHHMPYWTTPHNTIPYRTIPWLIISNFPKPDHTTRYHIVQRPIRFHSFHDIRTTDRWTLQNTRYYTGSSINLTLSVRTLSESHVGIKTQYLCFLGLTNLSVQKKVRWCISR